VQKWTDLQYAEQTLFLMRKQNPNSVEIWDKTIAATTSKLPPLSDEQWGVGRTMAFVWASAENVSGSTD